MLLSDIPSIFQIPTALQKRFPVVLTCDGRLSRIEPKMREIFGDTYLNQDIRGVLKNTNDNAQWDYFYDKVYFATEELAMIFRLRFPELIFNE